MDLDNSITLSAEQILAARDACLKQVIFAREYVLGLLEHVPEDVWFTIPSGCVSSVAWQVGHLTVAQYGLLLFRQRGRAEIDTEIMPGPFRKRFSKGTNPSQITSEQYNRVGLLDAMQRVYEESLIVVPNLDAITLWEPTEMPYAGYARKLGALLFCPMHEMIHAGQIGALRRALGLAPVR